MSGAATQPQTRRRWWRYILRSVLIGAPLIIGLIVWQVFTAQSALDAAIAATNAIDPKWRLADLMADRAPVPDNENSALVILAGHRLLDATKALAQKDYELDKSVDEALEFPAHRLGDRQKNALKQLLPQYEKALPEYCKTIDMPRGSYPFVWTPVTLSSQNANPNIRSATNALRCDFLERLEADEVSQAGDRIKAVIGLARSVGDEPFSMTLLIRNSVRANAVQCLERWLAQAEPDLAAMGELQHRIEEEAAMPMLMWFARSERAVGFENLENMSATLAGPPAGGVAAIGNAVESWVAEISFLRNQKTSYLNGMNHFGEIIKLPSDQLAGAIDSWDQSLDRNLMLVKLAVGSLRKVVESIQRSEANLRCAATALAAERFRKQSGRWPNTLDELVAAKLLNAVPLDPFDGKPLRWKTVDEGRLIYSVGPDRIDNDGVVNRADSRKPGSDVVVRLFDPARRRQPPRVAE